jgi:hypothetical protein
LLFDCGTPTAEAVVLTNRDVNERIAAHRRAIAQLERLRGTAAIVEGESVLSVYRPSRRKMRRMLSGQRRRTRVLDGGESHPLVTDIKVA